MVMGWNVVLSVVLITTLAHMVMPNRWTKTPRPDPAVLEIIDALRKAAEAGEVRSLVVVTVNPMLDVEMAKAGDDDPVRTRLLAAGLIEVSQKLLSK